MHAPRQPLSKDQLLFIVVGITFCLVLLVLILGPVFAYYFGVNR